jgi:AcrR family transcriptional regulator
VDSRRDELVRIAGEVFAKSGYSGTSLRDVADAAGILAGSLYHHFPSKEALAIELISAFHTEIEELARRPELTAAGPVDDLAEFAGRVGRVAHRHRAAVYMCMYDAPSTATEALSGLVRRKPAALNRRWSALVNAARDAGAFRDGVEPAMLRTALRTAVLDLAVLPGEPVEDLVRSLTALLLHGLAATPPSFAGLDASAPAHAAREQADTWSVPPVTRGRERKDDILATARDEFARRGYQATTIRDVAAAAGMRPSSMYRHFESKQEMVDAIMDRFSRFLLAGFEAVVGSPGSATERLDAMLRLMASAARVFRQEFSIVRSLNLSTADAPPADNTARLRLLESVVSDGITSGEFTSPRDPARLTVALRSTLWLPLTDSASSAVARRHGFLRESVLTGAATPAARRTTLSL